MVSTLRRPKAGLHDDSYSHSFNGPNLAQALSLFPSDFSRLPAVSFVIPNLDHDMHDGSTGSGDRWVRDHLGAYATCAAANNSVFVVTFDEDDHNADNQIPTIITGAHVKSGEYAEHVDHYRVLRTLTELFGASPVGAAADTTALTSIWTP